MSSRIGYKLGKERNQRCGVQDLATATSIVESPIEFKRPKKPKPWEDNDEQEQEEQDREEARMRL